MEEDYWGRVRNMITRREMEIGRFRHENKLDHDKETEIVQKVKKLAAKYEESKRLIEQKRAEIASLTEEDGFMQSWMADLAFLHGGTAGILKFASSSAARTFTNIVLQDHLGNTRLTYKDQLENLTVAQLYSAVSSLYLYGFDQNEKAKASCLPKRGNNSAGKPQLVEGLTKALGLQVKQRLPGIPE